MSIPHAPSPSCLLPCAGLRPASMMCATFVAFAFTFSTYLLNLDHSFLSGTLKTSSAVSRFRQATDTSNG